MTSGAAGAVCAAAVALPFIGAARAQAAITTTTFTPLTLVNGWSNYGLWAAATNVSGIVHLRGEMMTSGTNPVAFSLPSGDRPSAKVSVPVDMCNATNGRLYITPSGVVTVAAEGGDWGNTSCFTSLDGVSFAR